MIYGQSSKLFTSMTWYSKIKYVVIIMTRITSIINIPKRNICYKYCEMSFKQNWSKQLIDFLQPRHLRGRVNDD